MVMNLYIILILAIFGAVLGSFAGATVWRLRARQLQYDKDNGEEYDKTEFKQLRSLKNGFGTNDRSHCLHCNHSLAWYDLLPVMSWLSTKGTCRYCKKAIGWFELLIELMTACLFVLSYLLWPFMLMTTLEWAQFIVWLVALTGLIIVFWYDLKWFLVLWITIAPLLVLAVLFLLLAYINGGYDNSIFLEALTGVVVLAGLYWLLWAVSKGTWVGLGDAQIGAVLGLLLLDWQKAFLALLLANAIGTLIVLPGLITGKIGRKTAIPFGPLLIAGALISFFFGGVIIEWFTTDFSLFLAELLYP